MRLAKSYSLLWSQHTGIKLLPLVSVSREISTHARRRQKRHLSGHAAVQGSILLPLEAFPLALPPPPPPQVFLPIEWDLKGKGKSREVVIKEEIQTKDEKKLKEVIIKPWSDFYTLYAPGTTSISLKRLQNYFDSTTSIDDHLRLIIWILDQVEPPKCDVERESYRWRRNVYRKADKQRCQLFASRHQTTPDNASGSIDMLCSELLEKEIMVSFEYKYLRLLNIISSRATRRGCHRMLQQVHSILTSSNIIEAIQMVEGHVGYLIAMQEHSIIGRARRGEWEQIWVDRNNILDFLRQQKRFGELTEDVEDEWRLDVILIKSLVAHCTNFHVKQRRNVFRRGRIDLATDGYFAEQVKELSLQIRDIYGQISDRWLYNLILSLALGVEAGVLGRGRTLTLNEYVQRLPLTELVQDLFVENCQKRLEQTQAISLDVKHAMLALETNWEHHCRTYPDASGREKMTEYAEKHRNNVKYIVKLLAEHEQQGLLETSAATPHEVRRRIMGDIKGQAIACHVFIKSLLAQNEWETAIEQCKRLMDNVHPDEYYYSLMNENKSTIDQVKSTANAMLTARRLMRGSLINFALHLDNATESEKVDKIPALLLLVKDSITKGWWDPWPLGGEKTRRRLKLIKVRAYIADPPAELSRLYSRLLNMCRPVIPYHRNRAQEGYLVKKGGHLTSTFWTVLEQSTLWYKVLRSRIEFLDRQHFLLFPEAITRSKRLFRDTLVQKGSSCANIVWALLVNAMEKQLIVPRIKLLMNEIFLQLGIPGKGWTSARIALEQEWPFHATDKDIRKAVWDAFDQANQKWRDQQPNQDKPVIKAMGRQWSLRMRDKEKKKRTRMYKALRVRRVR